MLNVILIGAGNIAKIHAKVYKIIKEINIIAVIDPDEKKAESLAEKLHAKWYKEYNRSYFKEIVIHYADICVPTYLHSEYIIQMANEHYNILCEKPLTCKPNEMELIKEIIEKKQVLFMVAFCIQFNNAYIELMNSIKNEMYGKLKYLRMYRSVIKTDNNWIEKKELSGGIVFDLHIHDVNFILSVFGKPFSIRPYGNESYCITEFDYLNQIVVAEANWFTHYKEDFSAGFTAEFEKATLFYTNDELTLVKGHNEYIKMDLNCKKLGIENQWLQMYYDEINYFKDCVQDNKKPQIVDIDVSMDTTKVSNYILKKIS